MPNPEFNTLEEARAEIVRLNEELTARTNERDSYSTKVTELTGDLEKVRNLNQQYFLKLSAQYNPHKTEDPDEKEAPSCEDFAKSLTI